MSSTYCLWNTYGMVKTFDESINAENTVPRIDRAMKNKFHYCNLQIVLKLSTP